MKGREPGIAGAGPRFVASAGGLGLVGLLLLLTGGARTAATDVALIMLMGVAALHQARLATGLRGRARVARLLIVALTVIWLAILLNFTISQLGLYSREVAASRIASPLGVLALFCGCIALLLLPSAPTTTAGRIRTLLDGILVALCLFGLVWLSGLHESTRSSFDPAESVMIVSAAGGTIVVLTLAVLQLLDADLRQLTTLNCFAAFVAFNTALGLAGALLDVRGTETSFVFEALMEALAAVALVVDPGRLLPSNARGGASDVSAIRQTLPYVPVLVLAVAGAARGLTTGTLDPVLLWINGIGVAVIMARQYAQAHSNVALTRELRAHQQRLTQLAYHDVLTGLANRAHFHERLAAALAPGRPRPLLLLIDLDGFKAVNDTRGHGTGDQLLVAIAARLTRCVRAGDLVARLGGDEFAVLLPGETDLAAATATADRILAAAATPVTADDGAVVSVGASIGIAAADQQTSAEHLIRDADLALYDAKERGRNRYRVADQNLSRATLERMELEAHLRRALDAGELEIYYEPAVELASGRVVAAEALLRWRHPERGLLRPGDFLETAEATGLLPGLERHVLRVACQQLETWRRTHPHLTVSVHLCPIHLTDPALAHEVKSALAAADLPARALAVEVTEAALHTDPEVVTRNLHDLAALGVGIALDDYGSGRSSPMYLRGLPLHALKIDRAYVRELGGDPTVEALVRTILGMASALGLATSAEGVEHRTQAAQLQRLHCTHAQGSLFADPMPAAEFGRFLAGDPGRAVAALRPVG